MNNKQLLIIAAKGNESLQEAQCKQIEKVANVTYVSNLSPMTDQQLIDTCRPYDYLGLTRRSCKNFHGNIINSLPQLKGLSIYATGTEWVDTLELDNAGIKFKHLFDYSAQTVAEHALAMLLNCARRIHISDRIARGDLPRNISIRGWELNGKHIGLIGLGEIGYRIALLCKAFGMQVSYHDPAVVDSNLFESKSYDDLISQSDVLMLIANVDREKPVIINREEISKMKKGVYIINPSRPELVDKEAILNAFVAKEIAGYAVDDYSFTDNELMDVEYGRVLQTGHSAWYSDEAIARGTQKWIDNLVELVTEGQGH